MTQRGPLPQFTGTNDPTKPPFAGDDELGLEVRDYYSPIRSTFASGMHAAIVEGQIHGGVAQGIGGARSPAMISR